MNYQEFITNLTAFMQNQVGQSATIQMKEIQKNNGTSLDGMIINDGLNIAPTIYLNPYYHRYLDGVSMDEIKRDLWTTYEEHKPETSIDLSFFTDYNQVKGRIIYKLINFELNQNLLSDLPYIKYLDFAIVFLYLMDNTTDNFSTILIHNNHLNYWNITIDTLWQLANQNTPKLLPVITKPINDFITCYEIELEEPAQGMYISTNSCHLHGASCILYPEYLKEISQFFQSDFYILPSSIHETIFLKDDDNYDTGTTNMLSNLVKMINDTELKDEEVLSNHVYYFSRKQNCVIA